jgi:hypothetical protein
MAGLKTIRATKLKTVIGLGLFPRASVTHDTLDDTRLLSVRAFVIAIVCAVPLSIGSSAYVIKVLHSAAV